MVDSIVQHPERRLAMQPFFASTFGVCARLRAFNKHHHSRKVFGFHQMQAG
jgi:hypothetical protein